MILDFLKGQTWWILQILACLFVYIALIPGRIIGLNWKTYIFYMIVAAVSCSWMFLKSYELAPSFLQPWFIGVSGLALCGFLGSLFYFGETVSVINYIGVGISLVGAILLVL